MARPIWLIFILLAEVGLLSQTVTKPVRGAGWGSRDVARLKNLIAGGGPMEGRLVSTLVLDSTALRTAGLLRMAEGDLSRAILDFQEAGNRAPRDAAAWSDLSAALLTRARAEGRPLDLLRAIAAADSALAAAPGLPEALFNRAKALRRLYLRHQARDAWEAYLEADPASSWSVEARAHLRDLSTPSLSELWQRELPRLGQAAIQGDTREVQRIVRRFPQAARLHAEEEILPAWGRALEEGSSRKALERLAVAREIGTALAATTHDSMLLETLAAIDRAYAQGGVSDLARGHGAFGAGMKLYRSRQALNEARPLLAESSRLLGRAGSPFAGWADFYLAVCGHYGGPEQAAPIFLRLHERSGPERHPVLAGLTEWMLGTLEHNLGRPESALAHFRTASSLLGSASPQEAWFVHVLRAEAFETLGEIESAWQERLAGFEGAARSGDSRRLHSTFHEAAQALLVEGRPAASPAFLAELLQNDRAWDNPAALAETHLLRGRALDLLGRSGESLESFRRAESLVQGVAQSAQKDRISSMLALARGETLIRREPGEAVRILSAALADDLRRDFHHSLPAILTARAKARLMLGDTGRAESDLRQAIEEHERVRGGVQDAQLRLSYFERAQSAFDEMMALQIDHRQDAARAFATAERARARELLDLSPGRARLPGAQEAGTIQAGLPPGVTLVEYALLPDRLLSWVLTRGTFHLVTSPVRTEILERQVRALRSSIERRAPAEEIQSRAAALYDLLIRPLGRTLPAGGPLVFVPDRILVQLPFAALYDARRGRYLVEDHAVAIAPSATLYSAATAELRRFAGIRPWNVLAVGDPAFDRPRYRTLARLPDAAAEAADVAGLYESPDLLLGASATREAFLAQAGKHRVIHFAGHALLHPTSPRLSRLLFASGGTSPAGALYAQDIAGLKLEGTEVVVLSACRTLADNEGGREAVTGLAAAFLAAGPPVVVSSLWNVDDELTKRLMLLFHRALRQGGEPGAALREAQLQLLRAPGETLRSPASWAAFEAIGGAFSN